jgi:hypothetical protein
MRPKLYLNYLALFCVFELIEDFDRKEFIINQPLSEMYFSGYTLTKHPYSFEILLNANLVNII